MVLATCFSLLISVELHTIFLHLSYACAEKRKNGERRIFLSLGQYLLGADLETAVAAISLRTDKLLLGGTPTLLGGPALQQDISPGCVCVLCAAGFGQVIVSTRNEKWILLIYRGLSCNTSRKEADGCCIHH